MRIVEVVVTTCRVPLSRPIIMGALRFDAREYLLVELRTDEGLVGLGFGMTRDAPLEAILVRTIAPRILGRDPLLSESLWEDLYDANLTIGQRGLFMRCLSAVDTALWDIKAQAAGLPLWQLIGGVREQVPATVAGGYPGAGVTLDDLAEEVGAYAAAGYSVVKIAGGPLADDTERLRVAREVLGPDRPLAYDAHWAWRTVAEVLPVVRHWDGFGLEFIEDPFPSDSPRLAADLRERTRIPLALGEDVTGRFAYRDLLEQAPPEHLRLDATTTGGITEALRVCALAAAASIPVLPHIFPELHVHLAAGLRIVPAVEVTDPDREIDLFWRLLEAPLRPVAGLVAAPVRPGHGVALDRASVARYQETQQTVRR